MYDFLKRVKIDNIFLLGLKIVCEIFKINTTYYVVGNELPVVRYSSRSRAGRPCRPPSNHALYLSICSGGLFHLMNHMVSSLFYFL